MFSKRNQCVPDVREANSNASFKRTMWANSFYGAVAAILFAPAVSFAQAESPDYLNKEVQELRDEVHDLKKQVNATASQSPAANTAPEQNVVTYKGATFNLGGLKLTPGGFIEAATVLRSRSETSDINSSFTSYPFPSAPNYYNSELRESARQSRLQLLVQGPEDGVNKVEAFVATDFLSSGTTSNQNQSSSYTLRVREAYATWTRTDLEFYALAGQSWSLVTLDKKGINPRSENIPLVIDPAYVVGFNWLRIPQLRLVKNFGSVAALAVSAEQPEDQVKGTAPAGAIGPTAGTNGGLLNTGATFSADVAPDITVKAAFDPGFGHYEIYSLTRFFRDRAESTPGTVTSTRNQTTTAESIGGGLILPLVPKVLDFQASGIIGHGNGRYGAAQVGDSTYNTNNGSITALKEEQGLLGIVAHPTPRLDLYFYDGFEHLGSAYKYGKNNGSNVNCDTNPVDIVAPATAACNGISTVREFTGGYWWKFYKGPIGYLTTGAQVEYAKVATYSDAAGNRGRTNDTTFELSFRYYPYQ